MVLDSGTLILPLKKLKNKNCIKRNRSIADERNLIITITYVGMNSKVKVKNTIVSISKFVNLDEKESLELYKLLNKILSNFQEK